MKKKDVNREIIIIDKKDIKTIRNIFKKPLMDIVKASKKNNNKLDTVLKVVIPEEFIEELKNGNLKFMESRNGEILPNIVNSKNRIVKQIRLEEVKKQLNENNIEKLEGYMIEEKLNNIQNQLDYILEVTTLILKGQQNQNHGKVDGAINSIKQSFLEQDVETKKRLQSIAQVNLNEAISIINKDIDDGIKFFKEWENRSFIDKYLKLNEDKFSMKNIEMRLNKLCEDYLYIKKAQITLAKLKLSQGMNKCNLQLIIDELDLVNRKIEENKIYNWLPPKNSENEWKYNLLNKENKNRQLILEYNSEELIKRRNYKWGINVKKKDV